MTKDKDLTPEELSVKIAEMMGWYKPFGCIDWYDRKTGKRVAFSSWSPPTNWSHWGIVYEWMRDREWDSSHDFSHQLDGEECQWKWDRQLPRHSFERFKATDLDLRIAMLKAAWKAEGKGE